MFRGGKSHSLVSTQLLCVLNVHLGGEISMSDFYQNQNLSEKKTVYIRDRWKRKTKQLNIKHKIESVTDR